MKTNLSTLDFVENIEIEQRAITYIKIKVTLKPKGFLNIWYNAVKRTQSFSIILDDNRKWAFDCDNRIGWHEHPIKKPSSHISAESKTIPELISKLKRVWNCII